MKQPKTALVLHMTKDCLNGEIDCVTYGLNSPQEVKSRYRKRVRENQFVAELIYDCLVEDRATL